MVPWLNGLSSGCAPSPLKDDVCDGHSKQLVVAKHIVLSHLLAVHMAFPAAAESPRFPSSLGALLHSHQASAEALVFFHTARACVDSRAIFPALARDWGRTCLSCFQAPALVCHVFPTQGRAQSWCAQSWCAIYKCRRVRAVGCTKEPFLNTCWVQSAGLGWYALGGR